MSTANLHQRTPRPFYFAFERPVERLEHAVEELRLLAHRRGLALDGELVALEQRLEECRRRLYAGLDAGQRMELGRHPRRPTALDYARCSLDLFCQAAGDDWSADGAVFGGTGYVGGIEVAVVGTQCGRRPSERLWRNFGVPGAAGYDAIARLARSAAGRGLPVLLLLDACGAPGPQANDRRRTEALGRCVEALTALPVPLVAVLCGQAFAGGVLPVGLGDWFLVQECAGCPGGGQMPWARSAVGHWPHGAARDLLAQGAANGIVAEPMGGAHRDPAAAAEQLRDRLGQGLLLAAEMSPAARISRREGRGEGGRVALSL